MLQANHISFETRSKKILSDVSLQLRPGHFTALVGPNGAGKSSFLRVLANEYSSYRGLVHLNSKCIKQYTPRDLATIRAVLPQNCNVQFAFQARQIIMMGRFCHTSTKKENERIISEISHLTEVHHLLNRNYLTLSGGEKQRVQLARVLAQVWEEKSYPRYLLLDEPTASMDIVQQQNIFNLSKLCCLRNIGVLAIIHDLNIAIQYADELSFIREGKIIAQGHSKNVFTKMNIEKTYCCKVNMYHDTCSDCPYIIPEQTTIEETINKKYYEPNNV